MAKLKQRVSYRQKEGLSVDMFTREELAQIHLATLRVLNEAGVKIYNDEALNVFSDGGCKVDRSEKIVRIPQYVLEECIRSAPSSVLLAGRDPKHDRVLETNRVSWTNFGSGIKIYDVNTGILRGTTTQDVRDTALLVDYLDNVDVYSQAVVARDTPKEKEDLIAAEAFLTNTSKHCHHIDLQSGKSAKKFIEMGAAIAGGMDELKKRPIISALICPTSPLQISKEGCDIIMEFAKAEVPINILSMALSGGTAPITIDGTLVVHNAEVLAGIVLTQLVNKGAPVIYGSSTATFYMKTGTASVGSPELGMISACVACLAQFYNLPSYTAGG